MQCSPFIDAGEAYDADIEVQSSVAAAPAHPSVSMVFPPSPLSSQYVVPLPSPSTSYCVTMASPTTSHPFISSEESSEDEFCITPTFHTIQGHGHGQRRKLPGCQHRPTNTGRSRGRARSRSRGMGGRRGGHASLSAAGSSASALGPSSVRSTGGDVPVGAWKRIEPSSICHVYTDTPGPTSILVTSDSTPLQIFSRFFTDEVWELLVLETNRFAASVCGTTPRARPWIDVSQQEMRAFFGMLIYMGVCRLPRLGLYWTTKFPLDVHGVADVMSINDFQQLFRCLHLADNSAQIPVGQPGHDRLFKVRGLLDLLIPKFESEYHIHQECTIDEAMIPIKGRLAFKQYMKAKPTKWGIKVFVLADATNGYIRTFQIYTGKSLEDGNSSVGLCTKVVLDLMSGLKGSGLHLYTDNY